VGSRLGVTLRGAQKRKRRTRLHLVAWLGVPPLGDWGAAANERWLAFPISPHFLVGAPAESNLQPRRSRWDLVHGMRTSTSGVLLIIGGIYTAVFYRRGAELSASFHRQVAKMVPWLYRLPGTRAATSEKVWRPLSVAMGLVGVGVGIIFIIVTPK
jgi:hypothetical protein